MRRPLFAVCLFLMGMIALWYHLWGEDFLEERLTRHLLPETQVTLIADVSDRDASSIILNHLTILSDQTRYPISCKLICEVNEPAEIPVGSKLLLEGEYRPFSHATNPGEFDYATYYQTLNIAGKLKNVTINKIVVPKVPIKESLIGLREWLNGRVKRVFPEKEAGVVSAVLLGNKKELDQELRNLYSRNGVAHILSISGLHISLFGMGVYKLLRKCGLPMGVAAVCGGILLGGYGVMTGMSISATRAVGMYLIRMLGICLGRTYDMQTALGFVVFWMVVSNPMELESSGFLLSAGSVFGISVLYPTVAISGYELRNHKKWRKFLNSILGGLSITLATLPVQLWFYYEVPVYSVGINLLVLPWMGAVALSGMGAMLLPGGIYIGRITCGILQGYEKVCLLFEKLPFHTWNPGRPSILQMCLYLGGMVALILVDTHLHRKHKWDKDYREKTARRIKLVILLFLVGIFALKGLRENRVDFLDVGQGDCIVVRAKDGDTFLFDCGSSSKQHVGSKVLIPYLKFYGIHKIDGVFVSHFDADHYNGIRDLLENAKAEHLRIGQIFLADITETADQEAEEKQEAFLDEVEQKRGEGQAGISYLSKGFVYQKDDLIIRCLHPAKDYIPEDSNAGSLCFFIRLKEDADGEEAFTLLLTGDVQGNGEERLLSELKQQNIRNVTILKVAHHGSAYSTSSEFLEYLHPKYAVISCGENNRYGHPHEKLLERLKKEGCKIVTTVEEGAIGFR